MFGCHSSVFIEGDRVHLVVHSLGLERDGQAAAVALLPVNRVLNVNAKSAILANPSLREP